MAGTRVDHTGPVFNSDVPFSQANDSAGDGPWTMPHSRALRCSGAAHVRNLVRAKKVLARMQRQERGELDPPLHHQRSITGACTGSSDSCVVCVRWAALWTML